MGRPGSQSAELSEERFNFSACTGCFKSCVTNRRCGLYADLISATVSEGFAPPVAASSAAPVWRRCAAYIADSVFLALLGGAIGNIAFDRLWKLGPWGILVGYMIGSLYFASLDSRMGSGQTIGKRLLKVRLVNIHGDPISFARALGRYTIFAVPHLLYGWKLPEARTPWIVSGLIFVIILWVRGSTYYLILFDRLNRQGLHDLAVGSFVVYADHEGSVEGKRVPQIHWAILGFLLLAVTIGAAMANDWLERQPIHREFLQDSRLLESMDGVQRAHIAEMLRHDLGGHASKVLYISLTRKTKPADEQAFAYDAMKALMDSDRNLQSYDLVRVRLYYAYDIGIASGLNHRDFEQSPAQWGGGTAR